jgi:peroxiredoxin
MVATPSSMVELGTPMPPFLLPDTTSDRQVSSRELAGKVVVVAFICNHCPYVKHVRAGLAELGRFCAARGASMIAVSSNDASAYPEDGPDAMAAEAKRYGYPFPYLYDETQDVARSFGAECTPDFFVFDTGGRLAYRGQLDDSRPGNGKPVTGLDVRAAVVALLAGEKPAREQRASIGCNIKWKR